MKTALMTPVLASLRGSTSLAPELRARLARVELSVSPEETDFPSVDAGRTDGEGVIRVDVVYLWERWEQFGLAAMAHVSKPRFKRRASEHVAAYEQLCAGAALARRTRPAFTLGSLDGRHFGGMDLAFADPRPDINEALRSEHQTVASAYMAFVLLHELGHVANPAHPSTPEASRATELVADQFAFEQIYRMGQGLDVTRDALETEAIAQDSCSQAGMPVPASHPRWRERLTALSAFMQKHPPRGASIQLSGWSEDPASKQFQFMEVRMPRGDLRLAGRAVGDVTLGDDRFQAFVSDEEDGIRTLQFRRGNQVHRVGVWDPNGYDHRALWDASTSDAWFGQREFTLRTRSLLSLVALLAPDAEWQNLPARQFEERALDSAGVTGAKRKAVLAVLQELWSAQDAQLKQEIEAGASSDEQAAFEAKMEQIRGLLGDALYESYRDARFK